MIKKLVFIILLTTSVFATNGIIRVHEAPVVSKPNEDGHILMKLRKGTKVYLHPNYLNEEDYYVTLTRDGRKAYIRKDFIKLILNNESEDLGNTIYVKNDPTDYVIAEPLPDEYPLKGRPLHRAQFDLIFKKGVSSRYAYNSEVQQESTGFEGSLNVKYLSPATFDDGNRLYYGFFGGVTTGQAEYRLNGDIFTTESNIHYSFGPVVSYTFHKRQYFEIESMLQVGLNYQRRFVNQDDETNGIAEEKLFSGLFFNARLSINLSHKRIFDSSTFYLYHGPVIDIRLPSTLESDGQFTNSQLWPDNKISTDLEGTFGYNVGFTYRY
ncbi:hypothetical protein [Halobacteriovorax sp. RT-2-4]|uniref:hypothetical protein n=1 Tax=unclassified Halobacteriovorax TaxID=2639665 RepID=UPI00399B5A0F